MITIDLTEEEALLFRRLREQKIFEIKNGSATIHFDKDKKVSLIEVKVFTRY